MSEVYQMNGWIDSGRELRVVVAAAGRARTESQISVRNL